MKTSLQQTREKSFQILNEIDSHSLNIYKCLLSSFQECEYLAKPFKNLTGIFYHDLMKISTGVAIRSVEIKNRIVRNDLYVLRLKKFPYVDYVDLNDGIDLSAKQFKTISSKIDNPRKKLKYNFVEMLSGFTALRRKTIGVTSSSLLNKNMMGRLVFAGFKISFLNGAGGVDIPNSNKQIAIVLNHLENHMKYLLNDFEWNKFCEIIINHIKAHIVEDMAQLPVDILLCGTTSKLENRLLATEALTQGIPVIVALHGNSDGVLDEPIFGYGEHSYCNYLIAYGQKAKKNYFQGKYTHSLNEKHSMPIHVSSNSDMIRKIYNGKEIINPLPISSLDELFFLYVPTLFSSFNVYGPFRQLPDLLYHEWQERVLALFPNAVLKKHPKGDKWSVFDLSSERISEDRLELIIKNANGFIFDYMSTAFSLAAATDKPIIYLDIGLRNMHPDAHEALVDRCVYVDVEGMSDQQITHRVIGQISQKKINKFTPNFCLCEHEQSRADTVIQIVKNCLNGKTNNV